ncbi:MAG: formate dehydrogenase accessory sulfurtransferase FdhD, partial [Bryobacteraceae bacterium]
MKHIATVPVRRYEETGFSQRQDLLAVEEPLEIRLNDRVVAITMRTPGNDAELGAGFLFSEGILRGAEQIRAIDEERNRVSVHLADESGVDFARLERHFYVSSSCGICGKASIEVLDALGCCAPPRDEPVISAKLIQEMPEVMRQK